MQERQFFIYIMSSYHGTIYIGMTGNLTERVLKHKSGEVEGFSKKYKCFRLVYYEVFEHPHHAYERERQLKKWSRKKKNWLINEMNPEWEDLAADWSSDSV